MRGAAKTASAFDAIVQNQTVFIQQRERSIARCLIGVRFADGFVHIARARIIGKVRWPRDVSDVHAHGTNRTAAPVRPLPCPPVRAQS